jgi:hypothetical protein
MSPNQTITYTSTATAGGSESIQYRVVGLGNLDESLPAAAGLRAPSSTGSLRSLLGRVNAAIAPAAVVASFFAGVEPRVLTRISTSAATGIVQSDFQWFRDEWRYMPEYISREQVDELRTILALPIRVDGFDYRFGED